MKLNVKDATEQPDPRLLTSDSVEGASICAASPLPKKSSDSALSVSRAGDAIEEDSDGVSVGSGLRSAAAFSSTISDILFVISLVE